MLAPGIYFTPAVVAPSSTASGGSGGGDGAAAASPAAPRVEVSVSPGVYFTPAPTTAAAPAPPPASGAPAAAPVSSLDTTACVAEVRELTRRAAKLASSNEELRAFAAAAAADGDGDGDDDGIVEAVAENVAVLARVEERLAEVRRRLIALGGEHRLG